MSLQIARPLLTFAKVFFEDHHQTLPLENGAMMMTPKNVLPKEEDCRVHRSSIRRRPACQARAVIVQRDLGSAGQRLAGSAYDWPGNGPSLGQAEQARSEAGRPVAEQSGIDVWAFFGYWVPYLVGARSEVVVAMDWTSFAKDGQDTVVLSMLTGHGGRRR